MIARVWKARIDLARVDDYLRHFAEHVGPALASVRGYEGSQVLCDRESDPAELMVMTWWSSREVIQDFAGSDINRAVIDPAARQILVSCEESVAHYSVIAEDRL
jgi:heme-degrading monooxygenase HmoA